MAKALRTIGMIAGAVMLVVPGLQQFGVITMKAAMTISAVAGAVSAAASIGAQIAQKPPPVRGNVTQVMIGADVPQPYVMGEGYYAGILRHDVAYGAKLKKVPNPYRLMVSVYSGGGPIHSITPYVDQAAVSGWYSGFLSTSTQLGACPEASSLALTYAGAPGWDASSKLSGQAAIAWNLKFDKEGERFASGIPQLGAYGKWVKVYDPRKDSTFPGGSGAHRIGNEATYEWSENPALHAGTYAYGRYQNGKRTFGVGLPATAIDWSSVAAWANVCDANSWKIFGVIYEPMPETRWPNLRDICAAGGALPIRAAGILSFSYSAPRVALDTFTSADVVGDPGSNSVTAMRTRRSRINTVVPKVRSPDHNWELVASTTAVTSATYVTEDGQERKVEWPFNLVKGFNQGAQLGGYVLTDARELQPITLSFGERVRAYRPGDCVRLTIPELALDTDAIILTREYDHATVTTTFTFIGETPGKHAFALGKTGTAPPTPALKQTGEERDQLSSVSRFPLEPGQNVLFNGGFLYGLSGWGSAAAFTFVNDWRGRWPQPPIGSTGGHVLTSEYPVNVDPGEVLTLSASFVGTANASNFTSMDVEWRNGGNDALVSHSPTIAFADGTYGAGAPYRPSDTMTAPSPTDGSGYVKAYVRLGYTHATAFVGGVRRVFNVKLEAGDTATPYTDDATDKVGTDDIKTGAITQTNFGDFSVARQITYAAYPDYLYIVAGGFIDTSEFGGYVVADAECLGWLTYNASGLSVGTVLGIEYAIARAPFAPGLTETLDDFVTAGATIIATDNRLYEVRHDGLITSGSVVTPKTLWKVHFVDENAPADFNWYSIFARVTGATGNPVIDTDYHQQIDLREFRR